MHTHSQNISSTSNPRVHLSFSLLPLSLIRTVLLHTASFLEGIPIDRQSSDTRCGVCCNATNSQFLVHLEKTRALSLVDWLDWLWVRNGPTHSPTHMTRLNWLNDLLACSEVCGGGVEVISSAVFSSCRGAAQFAAVSLQGQLKEYTQNAVSLFDTWVSVIQSPPPLLDH